MKTMVVIGGGTAGATAASRAKRLCPQCRVILIEASRYITHAPCAIPYAIGDLTQGEIWLYSEEEFESERGVEVYTETRAVDVLGDRVYLEGKLEGVLKFDTLVIATGARPAVPEVEGVELEGVLPVRGVEVVDKAKRLLQGARDVAVVGAGYIGVEMADVLAQMGKRVVLIDGSPRPLAKSLDPDMSAVVARYMGERVELRLGERLVKIGGEGGRARYVETDGGRYPADVVFLATGVRPNVDLALRAGARLGQTGAVEVNEYMETAAPAVYAAGDVAEARHAVTGEPVWIPLAIYANKMGYVAGTNAGLGRRAISFPPVAGASVTKFLDMYIGSTGLTEEEARRRGIYGSSISISATDKARYMKGAVDVTLKAVVDREGRLVGMQIVGRTPSVGGLVDLATQFLGRPVEDMFKAEYSYMPFTASPWHPFTIIARLYLRERLR
ncbi:FAD-dependent pyridine nucleotide-disulfide oxidoreductase [Pyrobaculum islandicum DSM 4184]|uniref:FAD-dependent pyridine nucleotide-disulfide oxidoreductase n=1 Tax=Pyrobaculum islandicum (strain DSM 4184 / JCM 9189 / GEO3) TaxID=384616 RepID=A1RR43_PYRIL|nr:FAD-dependent oxidoreductase [Pyrobaculum islandicum]ABL87425.1 FAD-dependent pyridine nucleotide-disulfide oxidoreductase [Pyrobaculum islandicum DSM 4184]